MPKMPKVPNLPKINVFHRLNKKFFHKMQRMHNLDSIQGLVLWVFSSMFVKMTKQKPCKLGNKIYLIVFQIVINNVVDNKNWNLWKILPRFWESYFSKSETVY
jgi:hypothetical protein